MDIAKTERFVAAAWDDDIVPQLVEYIRIPNKSPMFDAQWRENGYMDAAVRQFEAWAKAARSRSWACSARSSRVPSS